MSRQPAENPLALQLRRGMAFHRLLEMPQALNAPDGRLLSAEMLLDSPWLDRVLAPFGLPSSVRGQVLEAVLRILGSSAHRALLGLDDDQLARLSEAGYLVDADEAAGLMDVAGHTVTAVPNRRPVQRRPDLLVLSSAMPRPTVLRVIDYKWTAPSEQWADYGAQLWAYRQMLAEWQQGLSTASLPETATSTAVPDGFLLEASGRVLQQSGTSPQHFDEVLPAAPSVPAGQQTFGVRL